MYTYVYTYIHTYITLHYITLHYITLHYITLHYITLHYITLHYIHTYIHYIHTYIHTYIHAFANIRSNIDMAQSTKSNSLLIAELVSECQNVRMSDYYWVILSTCQKKCFKRVLSANRQDLGSPIKMRMDHTSLICRGHPRILKILKIPILMGKVAFECLWGEVYILMKHNNEPGRSLLL